MLATACFRSHHNRGYGASDSLEAEEAGGIVPGPLNRSLKMLERDHSLYKNCGICLGVDLIPHNIMSELFNPKMIARYKT